MAYSKLFSSIVHSSLWTEEDHVRLLFVTLLAIADREGYIYGSRMGLERLANIVCDDHDRNPWDVLMDPDKDSSDLMRNPENEGRRIEEVPGGFHILNYCYYRSLRNDDDRREQNRQAQRRFREKLTQTSSKASQSKPTSSKASQRKRAPSASVSASSSNSVSKEKKKGTEEEVVQYSISIGLTEEDGRWFFDKCQGNGWKNDGKPIQDWEATMRSWKRVGTIFPTQKPNGQRKFAVENRHSADKIRKYGLPL